MKSEVTAKCQFDLKVKRLIAVEWTQKDKRDAGPVSPATTTTTTNSLRRTPIEQPEKLSDVAIVSVPDNFTPPTTLLNLELTDAKGRYEMVHAREWHMVSATDEHQVLRLMDHGDFIAQATITPLDPGRQGQASLPGRFQGGHLPIAGLRVEKRIASRRSAERSKRPLGLSPLGPRRTRRRRSDAKQLT